jgi:hypothetical protein
MYRAVYQFLYSFENNTVNSSNFSMFLLTGTEFRPNFIKTHYLEFVKLQVARILATRVVLGQIYSCVPLYLVPVLAYQYCCTHPLW